jgi:hypothetical protein
VRDFRFELALSELRLFFGRGYRVYFGEDAGNIVVILFGGDKSSQDSDIENAKAYWSIKPMGQLRTLDEFTDQYFRDHY